MAKRPTQLSVLAAALPIATACHPTGANKEEMARPPEVQDGLAVATFAGGCFWCMEGPFEETPGVVSATSGYTAGQKQEPTYKEVSAGTTGHAEAIRVVFDPKKIGYEQLLWVFWHNIDPTVADRQFCDRGTQYRTGIYFHDATQKALAQKTLDEVKEKLGTVYTELLEVSEFYPAETYHQDYYKKNREHYQRYRRGCGRDRRLAEIWGEAADH